MSMALKADVAMACRASGTEKPIDLVHLSSLTMGDRKLELEILKMFSAQIPQFSNMMATASSKDEVRRIAHTIKGAARSIGAFKLADIADASEEYGTFDHQQMEAEMRLICDYIADLG